MTLQEARKHTKQAHRYLSEAYDNLRKVPYYVLHNNDDILVNGCLEDIRTVYRLVDALRHSLEVNYEQQF